MRIGLLADIHEEVERLRVAIAELRARGVDRLLVLGDIFETGRRIAETVDVLERAGVGGVWGNHDFGLCRDVEEKVRRRYPAAVLDYFGRLEPWVEVAGCRFQHIEPHLDSEKLDDLWSYGGEGLLDPARCFAAVPQRRLFMGHVHRWALVTPEGERPWDAGGPTALDGAVRYLVVVHAVQQGRCAVFDTDRDELTPVGVPEPLGSR